MRAPGVHEDSQGNLYRVYDEPDAALQVFIDLRREADREIRRLKRLRRTPIFDVAKRVSRIAGRMVRLPLESR